ncbi:KSR2 Kinase, partial [Nyctibius bracteatus]|nr:KSR2 Kinase [Nyctibius bracteatus]
PRRFRLLFQSKLVKYFSRQLSCKRKVALQERNAKLEGFPQLLHWFRIVDIRKEVMEEIAPGQLSLEELLDMTDEQVCATVEKFGANSEECARLNASLSCLRSVHKSGGSLSKQDWTIQWPTTEPGKENSPGCQPEPGQWGRTHLSQSPKVQPKCGQHHCHAGSPHGPMYTHVDRLTVEGHPGLCPPMESGHRSLPPSPRQRHAAHTPPRTPNIVTTMTPPGTPPLRRRNKLKPPGTPPPSSRKLIHLIPGFTALHRSKSHEFQLGHRVDEAHTPKGRAQWQRFIGSQRQPLPSPPLPLNLIKRKAALVLDGGRGEVAFPHVSAPFNSGKSGRNYNFGHLQAGWWVPGPPQPAEKWGSQAAPQVWSSIGSDAPTLALVCSPCVLPPTSPGAPGRASHTAADPCGLGIVVLPCCKTMGMWEGLRVGSEHPRAVHNLSVTPSHLPGWAKSQNHLGWKRPLGSSSPTIALTSPQGAATLPAPSRDAPRPPSPSLLTPFPLFPARLKCHNKCTKEAPPCHLLIIHRGGKGLSSPFCLRGCSHQEGTEEAQESEDDFEEMNLSLLSARNFPRKASQTSIFLQEWDIPFEQLEIGELIGKGRFGQVFHGRWHGEVAIRLIDIERDNEDQLKAFKREVMAYRQTRHENVVLFMGACMSPPHLAIITSLCKGRTLYSVVRDAKIVLDVNKTRQIAQEIVKGMGYLHAKGILHKDLKSKNVFYDNGKVVITDFGLFSISGVLQAGRRENKLRIQNGWLCHLAPEIIRQLSPDTEEDKLPFSKHSDVFALGTIWYELHAREWPFKTQPAEAIIWQVGRGMKPNLSQIGMGKEISDILLFCWAYEQEERPTFTKLMDMLEKLPKRNRRLSHPGHFWKSAE